MTLDSAAPAKHSLAHYVQWFDGALEPAFCTQLIDSFNQSVRFQARNGRGVMSELGESSWTELNVSRVADAAFNDFFLLQINKYLAVYNERTQLTLPVPARARIENLRIKRYSVRSNDQFQPHFDSADHTSNRYLVFIWYLNDVAEGGETAFCDLDLRVDARAGRLLMFPPYWMYQHAGLPPRSNDKYIISTYLLF